MYDLLCMDGYVCMGPRRKSPPTEVAPLQESSATVTSQSRLYVPRKNITVRSVEDVQKILATELKAAKQRNKQ